MNHLDAWTVHSRLSDPREYAAAVASLPASIPALNRIVQGLLVHGDWLSDYGLAGAAFEGASRATLPAALRLLQAVALGGGSLDVRRRPEARAVATCRDFALLLCCFLRTKGIASRLRCGFAAYLGSGWEDHWLCEYWDCTSHVWRLGDAQINDALTRRCGITFDGSDVPRALFLTAGEAWLGCRAGRRDPTDYGHGTQRGWWFLKINVVRDHLALRNEETSAWDTWRAAPQRLRVVSEHGAALLDALAGDPGQPKVEFQPDWMA